MTRRPATWLVSLALLGVVLAAGVWWVGDRTYPSSAAPVAARSVDGATAVLPAPVPTVAGSTATVTALDVLRSWDRRRAHAFARGSVPTLRALYAPGSEAGTADVAVLREYRRRGLRVEGMRMQVLSVEVLERGPRRWRLRLTDRLQGAVAVGNGLEVPLPRDRASVHVVTLERESRAGRWKVAAVLEGGRLIR